MSNLDNTVHYRKIVKMIQDEIIESGLWSEQPNLDLNQDAVVIKLFVRPPSDYLFAHNNAYQNIVLTGLDAFGFACADDLDVKNFVSMKVKLAIKTLEAELSSYRDVLPESDWPEAKALYDDFKARDKVAAERKVMLAKLCADE